MPYRSRFVRPTHPAPVRLQPRDLRVFEQVHRYRYLTSIQLHRIVFAVASLKVVQVRLRKLWEHGYLERLFLPFVFADQQRQSPSPVYTLGRLGVRTLARKSNLSPIVSTSRSISPLSVAHDLAASDLMTSVEAAARARGIRVATLTERELRQQLMRSRLRSRGRGLLPDGAFMLETRVRSRGFVLEVVRAGARGGNSSIIDKLRRYVEQNRRRYLDRAYGLGSLRAVLVATTSATRAKHLRELSAKLRHGRKLLWFTSYEEKVRAGIPRTRFSPGTIFDPYWRDADGDAQALLPADHQAVLTHSPPSHDVCSTLKATHVTEPHAPLGVER